MNLEKVNRKFVDLIIEYCINYFGYSNYQHIFPRVILYNRNCRSDSQNCGYYSYRKNVICIFKPSHRNCLDLVNTIIHEYVHYLQSEKKYYKISKKHKYQDHPFELEACKIAHQHASKAKKLALKKLKNNY